MCVYYGDTDRLGVTSGGGATSAAGASCYPGSRSCHPISCGKVFLCQFPTEFARPGSDHVLRTPATPTLAAVYNRAPLLPLITRSPCFARVSRDLALSSRRSRAHYQLITYQHVRLCYHQWPRDPPELQEQLGCRPQQVLR